MVLFTTTMQKIQTLCCLVILVTAQHLGAAARRPEHQPCALDSFFFFASKHRARLLDVHAHLVS